MNQKELRKRIVKVSEILKDSDDYDLVTWCVGELERIASELEKESA